MKHLVIIEDDPALRRALTRTLERAGFQVTAPEDFSDPVSLIRHLQPDLVVLDLGLPGRSGYQICLDLKRRMNLPILILTALETLDHELKSLSLGADDFLTKPCHPDRLVARIERLLDVYGKMHSSIHCGSMSLDLETHVLSKGSDQLLMTETEARILALLFEAASKPVAKERLIAEVWGDSPYWDENLLQVNISRLRKSLDSLDLAASLQTVRGRGYAWDAGEIDDATDIEINPGAGIDPRAETNATAEIDSRAETIAAAGNEPLDV